MLFKKDDPFWRCIAESKNQSADNRLFTDETPQFLYLFVSLTRSCLKIRVFVRDQDEAEDQTADILKYVEDLRRGLNADIGRKDFFEMASKNIYLQSIIMEPIKIGIIGVGNCASSLLQGIHYYRVKGPKNAVGILNWSINGYAPCDIKVVSAFDIDGRKVGKDVHDAIFERPNCTKKLVDRMPSAEVKVSMGKILDGFSEHMKNYESDYTFLPCDSKEPSKSDVIDELEQTGTEILLNYLPVGSEAASRFYAECALEAGVSFINNIPVFIASDPVWAEQFKSRGIPIIGDDIKSQLGATIVHRALANLFERRGVKLEKTYQINTGGNTDFLNMLNRDRLDKKKKSKTEAVQAVLNPKLEERHIHIGPSDYVPWLNDNKVCFIRMEGRLFGNVPMNVELRLSVEDSPNSAGAAIDCIRFCKLALEKNIGGVLEAPSAYYCKHPPVQFTDDVAFSMLKDIISKQ